MYTILKFHTTKTAVSVSNRSPKFIQFSVCALFQMLSVLPAGMRSELADFRIPAAARVTSEQVWLSSASATSALKTAKHSAPRAGEQVGFSSHTFLSEELMNC